MLKFAGLLSAAIAALHLAIIALGGPAYRYFGAGEELARLAEQGSPLPALVTVVLALIFAVWAAYAFAAAGLPRRLPLLRTGLIAIGAIYTLRGILVVPQVWFISSGRALVPPRDIVFSLVSLVAGVAYLVGTKQAWGRLSRRG